MTKTKQTSKLNEAETTIHRTFWDENKTIPKRSQQPNSRIKQQTLRKSFYILQALIGSEHQSNHDEIAPLDLLDIQKNVRSCSSSQIVVRLETLFSNTLLFREHHTRYNIDQHTACQIDFCFKLRLLLALWLTISWIDPLLKTPIFHHLKTFSTPPQPLNILKSNVPPFLFRLHNADKESSLGPYQGDQA